MKVNLERRIPDVAALRPHLAALAEDNPTPFYAFDADEVRRNVERFREAFRAGGVPVEIYYAVKSNPCAALLAAVVAEGEGLDASSARELRLALAAKASRIVFTGPAKRADDFELVARHRRRVIVHLESPGELQALAGFAAGRGLALRCGLRISTRYQSRWKKFGMPLDQAAACVRQLRKLPQLELVALHFHSGTLPGPRPLVGTLRELGGLLRDGLSPGERDRLELIDIGGGIVPEAFEGTYPWNRKQTMSFDRDASLLERILADEIQPRYEPAEVQPIEPIAAAAAAAFLRHVAPLAPRARLAAEPGKYISHSALHLLFRLVELKGPQTLIVDGGTNMVGWEKYEYFDYAPIFNLTRWAPRRERPALVYGSLCTPHDLWGYYVRGRTLKVGDLLCMPFQGAYTYTLAQDFIRPVPPVLPLHAVAPVRGRRR